jgi:UDP-glucose 4-epimerase
MKKVLVTGGAGYIGSHAAVELSKAGYEVIIVDNFSRSPRTTKDNLEKILDLKIHLYAVDCTDFESFEHVFEKESGIEAVLHFASFREVGESYEQPLIYYRNNLNGLMNLLELMQKYEIPKLIFSSSCSVYGQSQTQPVTEETFLMPAESPYANSKRIGEEIIRNWIKAGNRLNAISLRYFNVVGAYPKDLYGYSLSGARPSDLFPSVFANIVGKKPQMTVFGNDYDTIDGTCVRDYIHVVDLVQSHIKAMEYLEGAANEGFYDVFNLGNGKGNSVLEVIKAFEKVTQKKVDYTIGERRKGDIGKVFASTEKSERILKCKNQYDLEKAIEDMWSWIG